MFAGRLIAHRSATVRALGAAVALTAVSSTQFMNQSKPTLNEPTVERRFAAAFLNAEGVATLRGAVQPRHNVVEDRPHLTVAYVPEGADLAKIASQLGRPVDLLVRAIVSDDHAQAVVVEVVKATDDDDGGVPFMVENAIPHVTISTSPVHDGYGPFYSNHLLARAAETAGGFDKDWKGVLEPRNGYEATECSIVVPKDRTILTATLCTSDLWNGEASRCGEEKQCGFCRFMKLGPCGKEFAAWEACIDACKETDEDFVEKCGSQTMRLKTCVDANPEYYYSVIDDEPKDDVESDKIEGSKRDNATNSSTSESIQIDTAAIVEIDPNAIIEQVAASSPREVEEVEEENYMTKG